MKRGDVVEFYTDNGWRTGVYDHTVERGKKFGMMIINIIIPAYERKLYVRPDSVKAITRKGEI